MKTTRFILSLVLSESYRLISEFFQILTCCSLMSYTLFLITLSLFYNINSCDFTPFEKVPFWYAFIVCKDSVLLILFYLITWYSLTSIFPAADFVWELDSWTFRMNVLQDSVYNLSEHPRGCSVMFKNRATHILRFPAPPSLGFVSPCSCHLSPVRFHSTPSSDSSGWDAVLMGAPAGWF